MVATLVRRQGPTVPSPAGPAGLGAGVTKSVTTNLGPSLALDDSATTADTGPAPTAAGVIPVTPTKSVPPPPTPSEAGASSSTFSTGMVVGVCVGAFLGALLIIMVGVVIYRRSAPKSRQHRTPTRAVEHKWDAKYPQTRQIPQGPPTSSTIAPMETLTANLFVGKSASVRSEDPVSQDTHSQSHNFAEYRPELAQKMAEDDPSDGGYLGRLDTGPTLSWGGVDGGRMSPIFSRAIPTPQVHDSPLHHAQSAVVVDPFADELADSEPDRRKSAAGNPFFGSSAQNDGVKRTRSRANSRASRSSEYKSKSRAREPSSHGHGDDNIDDMYASEDEEEGYYSAVTNPFSDPTPNQSTSTLTHPQSHLQPHIQNHPYANPLFQTSGTQEPRSPAFPSPVTPANDPGAIKGLLAAMEIPDGGHGLQAQPAARSTAMSALSAQSAYSDIDSAVAGQFPQPPT